MAFDYTYTVVSVNPEFNAMEVQYTAVDHDAITMSIPIPYADQDLAEHIKRYCPQVNWANTLKTYHQVPVGLTAAVSVAPVAPSGDIFGSDYEARLEAAIQRVLAKNAEGTV